VLAGKLLIFQGLADATTKKRTAAITEESQRDFFALVSHVDEKLTRLSSKVDADGKTYNDLKVLRSTTFGFTSSSLLGALCIQPR
jgi:hypothetical protein